MLLRLPRTLHYPITVTELLKQPNDNVERFAPLFNYSYKTTVTEGDNLGNEYQVEKTFPTRFESTVEGILKQWRIEKGAVITQSGLEVAEIEEPCAHGVQFGGMCVSCGKDMTEFTYNTEQIDAARATINMVHDNVSLTVSQDEATKVEEEAKRRLLASKKLSLVVDLDQTIIHATVDPTVAEWQKDTENPNHEAVKDVRAFQLVDDGPGARGCWYYIKLRPGLKEFLENVSKIYELHIYTMGTRAYAQHIAEIIDPDRKIFGDRILSRDESGSLVAKNLQRLFPVDTKMVVIIDDRGDVWKWNENLVKVTPYDFFVGIGDINSSFLPKKPDIKTSPKATTAALPNPNPEPPEGVSAKEAEPKTNGVIADHSEDASSTQDSATSAGTNVSALEQLVSMGGGDDPTLLQVQTNRQDEALAAQLQERPLLQKQKKLEAEEDAASDPSPTKDSSSESSSDSGKPRHNLLIDHDTELQHLEQSLRKVHSDFFDIYARNLADAQGGRLAELRNGPKSARKKASLHDNMSLALVPDIKTIMPSIKRSVLEGVVLVFSGVVPLGTDIQNCDIALWAKGFGARVEENVGRRTTHVIAARNRTAKVRQALKRGKGRIKIVSTQWLTSSIVQWLKLPESPYLLKIDEADKPPTPADDSELLSDTESVASASALDTDDEPPPHPRPGPLTLQTAALDSAAELEPASPADDHSPVGGSNEDCREMV
ncbi:rna polymerase ii ctd phosphatase [Lasallia pustulata]|uniref:RNA polymerase II subunit A C-terminal domain phosphatase n=1 Tax=Lasallia pustulata TaxID=136370 RepID=A0A1W5DDS8_9LECA|nr:rna polymerase ii ctd phosphatase [Lasallia pustulata]